MRLIILFLLAITTTYLNGQNSIKNESLSLKIDSLASADQKWRLMDLKFSENQKKDSVLYNEIQENWSKTDSLNLIESKHILSKYGFPGIDMVGTNSSGNFFLLIQHADSDVEFQEKCLKLMYKEVKIKNANGVNYAFLVDRVCVNKKKKQIYGTQMWLNKQKTSFEIPKVINPRKLNERRKLVGLEPIEDYIKSMNELYSPKMNHSK
jgi:hypothetical protein